MNIEQIVCHLRNGNYLLSDNQDSVLQTIERIMGKLTAATESGKPVSTALTNYCVRVLMSAAGELRVHAIRCESVACEVERLAKDLK